jgi:hypothetical protein
MSVSQERFHENFRKVGIDPPAGEHKGWFEDTVPDLLPQRIAFAFVDTDLETSTAHVLPHMYERLVPGGICMFGLYTDDTVLARPHTPTPFLSPGVKRAVEAFLRDKPEKAYVLYANENTNGYFRKTVRPSPCGGLPVPSPPQRSTHVRHTPTASPAGTRGHRPGRPLQARTRHHQ